MAAFYSYTNGQVTVGPEDDVTAAQDRAERKRNAKTNHV